MLRCAFSNLQSPHATFSANPLWRGHFAPHGVGARGKLTIVREIS
jgi:hypothetical protein